MLWGRELFFRHPPARRGSGSSRSRRDRSRPAGNQTRSAWGKHLHTRYPSKPRAAWPVRGPPRTGAPSCAPPQTARAGTESRLPGRAERAGLGGARRAPLHRRRRRLPGRPSRAPRSRPAPRAPLQPAATVTRAHPRPAVTTLTAARETRGVTRRRRRRRPEPSHRAPRAARACAEGSAPAPGQTTSANFGNRRTPPLAERENPESAPVLTSSDLPNNKAFHCPRLGL